MKHWKRRVRVIDCIKSIFSLVTWLKIDKFTYFAFNVRRDCISHMNTFVRRIRKDPNNSGRYRTRLKKNLSFIEVQNGEGTGHNYYPKYPISVSCCLLLMLFLFLLLWFIESFLHLWKVSSAIAPHIAVAKSSTVVCCRGYS